MDPLLLLLLYAFLGLTVLGFLFVLTAFPWQTDDYTPWRSPFDVYFWLRQNEIFDIPREEKPTATPVRRFISFPRLFLATTTAVCTCALFYAALAPFDFYGWLFVAWSVLFALTPIFTAWWMYKQFVLRFAYMTWSWIFLASVLVAYIHDTSIFDINSALKSLAQYFGWGQTAFVAMAYLIGFAFTFSAGVSALVLPGMQEQAKEFPLASVRCWGCWQFLTYFIYFVGATGSILVLWQQLPA